MCRFGWYRGCSLLTSLCQSSCKNTPCTNEYRCRTYSPDQLFTPSGLLRFNETSSGRLQQLSEQGTSGHVRAVRAAWGHVVDHVTDQGRSKLLLLLLIILFYLLLFWATETDFLTHTQKKRKKKEKHTLTKGHFGHQGAKGQVLKPPPPPPSARAWVRQ